MVHGYVCYYYRNALKTPARSETILLAMVDGEIVRVLPAWRERSRTGSHGKDCYDPAQLDNVIAIAHIEVSNAGKHHCDLKFKKATEETVMKVLAWLQKHEHVCPSMLSIPEE